MKMRTTVSKRRSVLFAASALTLAAGMSNAACVEPSFDLSIPDGKSASDADMASAQEAVKQAVQAGEAFVVCVRSNESSVRAERLSNEVLDKMQTLAADFNRQLRYFRRAN